MPTFSFWEPHLSLAQPWRVPRAVPIHITGMGLSFILMLIAFYLDNGKNLPVWKDLPSVTYWLVPGAVGVPLIVRALLRYRRFAVEN